MKYSVLFSYSGYKEIEVEAPSLNEAIDKAYEKLDDEVDCIGAGLPETEWEVEEVMEVKDSK